MQSISPFEIRLRRPSGEARDAMHIQEMTCIACAIKAMVGLNIEQRRLKMHVDAENDGILMWEALLALPPMGVPGLYVPPGQQGPSPPEFPTPLRDELRSGME